MLSGTDDDDDDDDEKGLVAGFDSIPVPWLTSVASRGCSQKSAPTVDAEVYLAPVTQKKAPG